MPILTNLAIILFNNFISYINGIKRIIKKVTIIHIYTLNK